MALDKLVDSGKLDAALNYEVSRINAKTGGSASLYFDLENEKGFGDAIDAIPSGVTPTGTKQIAIAQNGTVTEDVTNYASAEIDVNTPDTLKNYMCLVNNQVRPYGPYEDNELDRLRDFVFYRCSPGITSLRIPNCIFIGQQVWYLATPSPSLVFAPKAQIRSGAFYGANQLEVIVCKGAYIDGDSDTFRKYSGEMLLNTVDLTANARGIRVRWFENCVNLTTLILRDTSICPLGATNAFDGTRFASGGTGGTIYIPKSLYDHLGDNSSSDYKAATNWSIINGYGTITWAKIEGSQYDGYYADGTPIPT